jgi:hypothetical protein
MGLTTPRLVLSLFLGLAAAEGSRGAAQPAATASPAGESAPPAAAVPSAASDGTEQAGPRAPKAKPEAVWETGHFSFIPRSFQRDPRLDILVFTDFTTAGRKAPQASVEHPIYYTGSDGGLTNVGEAIGGEEIPPATQLAKILVQALKQSGYVASDATHPPTIYIHYRWGSFNRLPALDGPPDDMDRMNLLERAALVGGAAFAVQMAQAMNAGTLGFFEDSSSRINFLVQEAHDDRYFIIATGYDYEAAKRGKVLMLWSTKISTNSRGVTMKESLPQLVASAAPYFGHPTAGPVRLNRPVVKEGSVIIGVPTVVEDLPSEAPAAPPAQVEAPPPAAEPAGPKR